MQKKTGRAGAGHCLHVYLGQKKKSEFPQEFAEGSRMEGDGKVLRLMTSIKSCTDKV